MSNPVHIVVGLGELGSSFATGLLKNGLTVVPVTRQQNMQTIAAQHPNPASVWLCVGEKDLADNMANLPTNWQKQVILIQNELLPNDWLAHGLTDATVISVWFEKKAGKAHQVVQPSVVYGAQASLAQQIYDRLNLPVRQLATADELLFELVLKNLYIQISNIAGLQVGGTTSQLVEQHGELMQALAMEMIQLQEALTQQSFDQQALLTALTAAFYGDPNHQNMGRSAPARLARAQALAEQHQLDLPMLKQIATTQTDSL